MITMIQMIDGDCIRVWFVTERDDCVNVRTNERTNERTNGVVIVVGSLRALRPLFVGSSGSSSPFPAHGAQATTVVEAKARYGARCTKEERRQSTHTHRDASLPLTVARYLVRLRMFDTSRRGIITDRDSTTSTEPTMMDDDITV